MFAALIPLVAQFIAPILNMLTSGITQLQSAPRPGNHHKNFLEPEGNDMIPGLASKALSRLLDGFGSLIKVAQNPFPKS